MVGVLFLEGMLRESIVDLGRSSYSCDSRLINNTRCQTLLIQGTVGRYSAFTQARGWCIGVGAQDLGVMSTDDGAHGRHTAVTAFNIIPVE